MEAIKRLKVDCPYEILKIEDVHLSCRSNEHGYLYLKCLIDDIFNFKYSIEASTNDKIILYEELEDEMNGNIQKKIIFNGIIQRVKTTNENGVYSLEIKALTTSSLMDIEEKSRSFQDSQMSYDNLINEVLKDYSGYRFTQCMSMPMSIGRPLFQYKETDFKFLKRVASCLGLELFCDIINSENMFYFGRPKGLAYALGDDINYIASKDLERYYKAMNLGIEFHDTDFFYYEVMLMEKLELGDLVNFKQKTLYVNQYKASYYQGEIIYTYRLCRADGIWQDQIYNKKIKGVSLESTVLEVSGECLKLKLNIDEEQDQNKAAWFIYAPTTGNIMYSMPIVGESAMLYFPNEYDRPIVTGCARKNGSTCPKLSTTNNRYFATEAGNYLDILPSDINIHRSNMSINLNDKNGVNISSSGNLNIGASGGVSLSGGSVSISGGSKVVVQKGKGGYISLEGEFYSEGSAVYENGSDRQSYSKFTDDEPTNGVAEALEKIERQKKFTDFKEKLLMEAMCGNEQMVISASLQDKNGEINSIGDIIKKSYNSLKEIPKDLWHGFETRGEKAFDSSYDFINWMTMGFWDGMTERTNKMMETGNIYDIGNWATSGLFDMAKEAVNPEDPLSKEHWLNSFGLVSTIFGAKASISNTGKSELLGISVKPKKMTGKSKGNIKCNIDELTNIGKEKNVNNLTSRTAEIESVSERFEYYKKLKDGVIDDTAWSKLNKYSKKEKIDLNNISWDEKMSMINKFKSEIIADQDSMKYIENSANELLKLSDVRLQECIENGYKPNDYYRILNQDKSIRNPDEYLKTLKDTKLIDNWNEAFYGNDSEIVISYMPKDAYDNFVIGYRTIGRAGEKGGQFVLPQKVGDSIESKLAGLGSISNSTVEFKVQLAKELGLPEDVFANGVIRVEIPLQDDIKLQMVTGIQDGCNYQWIPGGKTLGGTVEGIIRQITETDDPELYNKIISNVKK